MDIILEDLVQIKNVDEAGLQLSPKNKSEAKNVYEVDIGPAKDSTPPIIVHHYKRLLATVPIEWSTGLSDIDWVKSELFSQINLMFYMHS